MDTRPIPETDCCPKFNPEPWDGKVFDWQGKPFIKDKVFTLFYMPVNFGSVMTRLMAKVERAGAKTQDNVCLSEHSSKWRMDVYLAVDKMVPEADNVALSGKFLCKVYEGPYDDTGKWTEDFGAYAKGQGYDVKKTYMWYTTCPKCAKAYGKNYVAIVAQVATNG